MLEESVRQNRVLQAGTFTTFAARSEIALGNFAAASDLYDRARALGERVTHAESNVPGFLLVVRDDLSRATGESLAAELAGLRGLLRAPSPSARWAFAVLQAALARAFADAGDAAAALETLAAVLPAIERAPGWAINYTRMACDAAETVSLLEATDHVESLERNILAKVVEPDWRYPMVDGRLSLAHLCAVQGRDDEASRWFDSSRAVLEEQGAPPLRAIADHDEALMYARRGDDARARPLLDAAVAQFEEIGMTGWIRRAARLRAEIG